MAESKDKLIEIILVVVLSAQIILAGIPANKALKTDGIRSLVSLKQPNCSSFPCDNKTDCHPQTWDCLPIEAFGNINCSKSADCGQKFGLTCKNHSCICDPNSTLTSSEGCVGKAENPCVNTRCSSNAVCRAASELNHNVTKNATTRSSRGDLKTKTSVSLKLCQCIEGYFSTPNGSCARDIGIACNKKRPCKSWLTCGSDGSCKCRETHRFDQKKSSCLAKVNQECNSNFTTGYDPDLQLACVEGAVCVQKSDVADGMKSNISASYYCMCQDGLVENNNGTCDLAYGSPCKVQENGTPSNLKCDRKLKLLCSQGSCICPISRHVYDEAKGKCVGLSGASCTTDAWDNGTFNKSFDIESRNDDPMNSSDGGCTEWAKCQPAEGTPGDDYPGTGTCKCIGETLEDGSCAPKEGDTNWITVAVVTGAVLVPLVAAAYYSCRYLKQELLARLQLWFI